MYCIWTGRYLAAHPELQRQVCAFVEFEAAEAAGRAVREVADPGGLQVSTVVIGLDCGLE